MSSIGHNFIAFVLVVVLPLSATAAGLLPCCCTTNMVGQQPACCADEEAVPRCGSTQERATESPSCGCQHSRDRHCDSAAGCGCVASVPPLTVSPIGPQVERPQQQYLYRLNDYPALAIQGLMVSRVAEQIPGRHWPARPSLMVILCSWLK